MNSSNRSFASIAANSIVLVVLLFSLSGGYARAIAHPFSEKQSGLTQVLQITSDHSPEHTSPVLLYQTLTTLETQSVEPMISAGAFHTCAVIQDAAVKCWGENAFGALGDGTNANKASPTLVIGLPADAYFVTAGRYHTCALLVNGDVYCWGRNNKGQLGDGTIFDRNTPVKVLGFSETVTAIDAGDEHSCALMQSGKVTCWGNGSYGQLGNGTLDNRAFPVEVIDLIGAVEITAGGFHSCAVLNDGTARCWGRNDYGQLGDGSFDSSSSPVLVGGNLTLKSISAGYGHTCAATLAGDAWCWGLDDKYQVGDITGLNRNFPGKVAGINVEVAQIEAGYWHSCILGINGYVSCWGWNFDGELGDGTTNDSDLPVAVIGLESLVTRLAPGGMHTCVLTGATTGMCWGNNASGQVGNTILDSQPTPVSLFLGRTDAPTLDTLNPQFVQAGSGGIILEINGTGFEAGDLLNINGQSRSLTLIDGNLITTQLTAEDLQKSGVLTLIVSHPESVNQSNAVSLLVYTFADVLPGSWAFGYVEGFYAKGITSGCAIAPYRYCPNRAVTRAEMAVFILRSIHADALPYTPNPDPADVDGFADLPVRGKEWMKPWIEEFYSTGITSGCGTSPLRFCPERPVTRAEMAVFVLRALRGADYQPPAVAVSSFGDVPAAGKQWMMPWIEEFYRAGMTTGCKQVGDVKYYCPEQSVTRAQMATFIDHAFGFPVMP